MYNFFSEKAKKVLHQAHKESFLLGHKHIGTEHIILALLKIDAENTGLLLNEYGITYEIFLEELKNLSDFNENSKKTSSLDFTPLAKLTMRIAFDESRTLNQHYVGCEHLLLGILRVEEGIGIRILINLGANISLLRDKLKNSLKFNFTRNYKSGSSHSLKKEETSETETPFLTKYAIDITKLAKEDKLDPVIGREDEISRLMHILSRRKKNNPCLIGEPGVGKTAIVEGLAQKIIKNQVPRNLAAKRILQLDIASVIAGAKFRGEFEERLKSIIQELLDNKNIILFIDEIHTIVGTGGLGGSMDAANILKPALSRGEIQCVGATTLNEYRKYIEKDAALERRFQPILVEEPSVEETINILKGLKEKYETFHRVKISDEALEKAAYLSNRYITGRNLPDKAIDIIDEAAAQLRLSNLFLPPEIIALENELLELKKSEEEAYTNHDFEAISSIHITYEELESRLKSLYEKWEIEQAKKMDELELKSEHIEQAISNWTGIPVSRVLSSESEKLLNLEKILQERVIGQEQAIKSLAQAVRRARAGLTDPKRPNGSFIFLGPTGCGKTELAKALAEALYGSDDNLVRLDMSEFMEKHNVSKMTGAPPGYIGYDEAGQLTEKVRRNPYCVVLFDEIEKAHPEVFNILLQVLEDGRLTDGHGKTVDFRNTILIMTSNLGSPLLNKKSRIGFSDKPDEFDMENLKLSMQEELKKTFRPEFINRIDEIIFFNPLGDTELFKIANLMLKNFKIRVKEKGFGLEISDAAIHFILSKSKNYKMGARPLRRTIQNMLENQIANYIIEGVFQADEIITVNVKDNKLVFNKKNSSNECKAKQEVEQIILNKTEKNV